MKSLQLCEAGNAAFQGVVALDDPFLIDGHSQALHCSAKVVFTGDGGVELVGPSEEGDAAVTEIDEVIDSRTDTGRVVEQDSAGFG